MAHWNDATQGALLAEFLRELRLVCGTHYHAEMQMHMIADAFSKEDRELLACWTMEDTHG